ncbi:zinc ribbon domain-containing protein [Opitutaceae bacterium EW11]|nr:zinc ribbon domain-containing protein [Opitutaceae bacterium EW11]
MTRRRPPPYCAQCGAEIPPNARACPECGADERTGWDEVSIYDGLDLPEAEDVDGASERLQRREQGVPVIRIVAGLLLVAALIGAYVLYR